MKSALIYEKILEPRGITAVRTNDGMITFDHPNVRSRSAAFDPAKKDSSDLLASIGLLGMIGGGAAMTEGE